MFEGVTLHGTARKAQLFGIGRGCSKFRNLLAIHEKPVRYITTD